MPENFESQIPFLVALHRATNLTAIRFGKLENFFGGDWRGAWNGKIEHWQEASLDPKSIQSFFQNRTQISPEREMEKLAKCGAKVLVLGQKDFPIPLQSIENPPPILFCRGEISDADFPAISVVGSRRMTTYGRRAIEKIIPTFANAKMTVVSGLALGCDFWAEKVAFENSARTISVLGNGIDRIYPATNAPLAEKILAENAGAILSQHLPGIEPRPEFFPLRNRIVAALSTATIVVEAAKKSGSLITAEFANDLGRRVFAVPGDIFSPNAEGANQLIESGNADPALSGEQILGRLGLAKRAAQKSAQMQIPSSGIEAEILKLFASGEKIELDDLIRKCKKFPAPVVTSTVTMLEIKGLLRLVAPQTFMRNY